MSELEALRNRLKSGEYDGVDIMKAWMAIEELDQLHNLFDTELKGGGSFTPTAMLCRIYELEKMRDYNKTWTAKLASDYEKQLEAYKEFESEIQQAPYNHYSVKALLKLGDRLNEQL